LTDAGDLDDDAPRAIGRDLGAHLRLRDADAAHAPLDDVARRLEVSVADLLAGERLHRERDPDAALQVEPQHGADVAARRVGRQPVARQVDVDRQQQRNEDHPRGDAAPAHALITDPFARANVQCGALAGPVHCHGHETRRVLRRAARL